MKLVYQTLFILGLAISITGVVFWVKAGFPFTFGELSTILFGTKPFHLGKESYFFIIVLGVLITAFSVIELSHKRWEKK